MVLDTGASSVVLTHDAAVAAGLPVEMIHYTVSVDTANGRAQAAPVTLDRIAVGSIVERQVPALIAPPGQLRTSLLGMSFLSRLQGWEVRGDKVTLRGEALSMAEASPRRSTTNDFRSVAPMRSPDDLVAAHRAKEKPYMHLPLPAGPANHTAVSPARFRRASRRAACPDAGTDVLDRPAASR